MNIESLTAEQVIMTDAGCDAVPVVSGQGLVGMITARDVVSAVAGRSHHLKEGGEVVTGMFHLEPVIPARS